MDPHGQAGGGSGGGSSGLGPGVGTPPPPPRSLPGVPPPPAAQAGAWLVPRSPDTHFLGVEVGLRAPSFP